MPTPTALVMGNWEFVFQTGGQSFYADLSLVSASAGSYSTAGLEAFEINPGFSFVSLDQPDSSFTLSVSSTSEVNGSLVEKGQEGEAELNFAMAGTASANGDSITGTFDSDLGNGTFTAAAITKSLNGSYSTCQPGKICSASTITEDIQGPVITETSEFGSGSYNLGTPVGNFAYVTANNTNFWNASEDCDFGFVCAVWWDANSTVLLAVSFLPAGDPAPLDQTLGVLYPQ